MSLLNYFTKTLSSAAVSEGTGSAFLAHSNEGSRKPEDGDSCATEVEILYFVTPTVSKSGRNFKRKTVSAPKRRKWNDDYLIYGFYRAKEEEHTITIQPLIVCFVQSNMQTQILFLQNLSYIVKNNIPNISLSLRSFLSLNYLRCKRSKKTLSYKW